MSAGSTRVTLPAGRARVNERQAIGGTFLKVLELPADLEAVTIRIDDPAAAALELAAGSTVKAPCGFGQWFVEHDASAEDGAAIAILIGTDLELSSEAGAVYGTDADGLLFVRLADRLDAELDSIAVANHESQPLDTEDVNGAAEWGATANQDNAVATATRAAVAGSRHYAVAVLVGFTDPAATGTYRLTVGGAAVLEGVVHGSAIVALPAPYGATEGSALAAQLDASGAPGTLGYVTLLGFTREA